MEGRPPDSAGGMRLRRTCGAQFAPGHATSGGRRSRKGIGGYLLLTDDSLEEATAIAEECPNLSYGTVVEVRPS